MLLSEEAFHADSEVVLDVLSMLEGDSGSAVRWRLALWGIDRLLDDFGFDLERKLRWAGWRKQLFANEFGVDKAKRIRLGDKFRKERKDLESLMSAGEMPEGGDHELAPALSVLQAGSRAFTEIGERMRALAEKGRLTISIEEMTASLAHMRANRLLRSAHRAQEAVIYDFLERIYEARAARQKAGRRQTGSRVEAGTRASSLIEGRPAAGAV